jgi:hypothetical protein
MSTSVRKLHDSFADHFFNDDHYFNDDLLNYNVFNDDFFPATAKRYDKSRQ